MKKPERYFYPAVFTYDPGKEIAVVFPDLDCATSGTDDHDALLSARELLGIVPHLTIICNSITANGIRIHPIGNNDNDEM